MLDKTTNANTIQSLLIKDRVNAATINTLFGLSNATILAASQTITIVVDYVNTSSKATHTDVILGGTNILKYLYNYCLKNNYKAIEFKCVCNAYTEGSKKARFVRGNKRTTLGWYQIVGVQKSHGGALVEY